MVTHVCPSKKSKDEIINAMGWEDDGELAEGIELLYDEFSDCLEEKFISGDDDEECYGDGSPVIIVPKNWPPRWTEEDRKQYPRRVVIYLDDLINFYGYDDYEIKFDGDGIRIDPLNEIRDILRSFPSDCIKTITIFGSYWAANEVFGLVNQRGSRLSKTMSNFIDSISKPCVFKFVISRGVKSIKKSSAVNFICY